jgi:sigma-B regulation protein RsbU (phosphoserine phosphatase)
VARNIQTSILPRNFKPFPDLDHVEIDAYIDTANEVGGDFYDFFKIDDQRLGFVIGDVSGKGIPAAIFMAVSKTSIKSTAIRNVPANECLQVINNTLAGESVSSMFVTAIYGILNITTGEVEFCNAGHNYPYLISSTGNVVSLTESGGIPLGYLENFNYDKHSIKMNPGDTLFFYTDGVSEAMNAESDEFSEARLKKSLQNGNGSSLKGLVQGVIRDVKDFTGGIPQSDDITILAIKYL